MNPIHIKDIGGEFALIDQLTKITTQNHPDLIVGIGDDAAVIRTAPEPAPYLLVTTDILVEGRHFKSQWATPDLIGIKAAECNLSDIAAMGGTPTWMFISLVLNKDTDVRWVQALYSGIFSSCQRHGAIVSGGDTTQGPINTINITVLGSVAPDYLCLRSHAAPGDLLMVTGSLGASAAGLALLSKGIKPPPYLYQKHVSPSCRLDVSRKIAAFANAMIDISDGLGSEVNHICRQSMLGAEIDANDVPMHEEVRAAAELLGINPLDFAISGGEDFEILFSIQPEKQLLLKQSGLVCHPVGRLVDASKGVQLISSDGRKAPLPGGYNHFK